MKKLYLGLLAALVFTVIITSNSGCKLDKPIYPDSLSTTVPAEGIFSAKINGTLKTADQSAAYYFSSDASQNFIQIVGTFGTNEGIQIQIKNPRVGVFELNGNIDNSISYVENTLDPESGYTTTDDGTITITSFDGKVIKGTFSGTVRSVFGPNNLTKIITEGKFECKVSVF